MILDVSRCFYIRFNKTGVFLFTSGASSHWFLTARLRSIKNARREGFSLSPLIIRLLIEMSLFSLDGRFIPINRGSSNLC